MPDFTNVEAVKLDAKRRVYANLSRLYLLSTNPGDEGGYSIVHLEGSSDGRLYKNWFVDDQGFLNAATFHIADVHPFHDDIAQTVDAFGYCRHVIKYPTIWVYTLAGGQGMEMEILGTKRVYKYHTNKTGDKIYRQM